jgi:hypothetical protein
MEQKLNAPSLPVMPAIFQKKQGGLQPIIMTQN